MAAEVLLGALQVLLGVLKRLRRRVNQVQSVRVAGGFFSWVNARVPNPRTNPLASTLATITLRLSIRSSAHTAAVMPQSKLMAVPVI